MRYDSRHSEPGLIGSLKMLVEKKQLLKYLIRAELYNRYKRSALGLIWTFLNPLLIGSVIFFVFGRVFHGYLPQNHGYAIYVFSGILLQSLFLQGIPLAAQSLQSNSQTLTKMNIPPLIFIFSSTSSQVANFTLGSAILLPISFISKNFISWHVIFLPLFLCLAVFTLSGLGLSLSGLFMRFDDFAYLLGVFLMILSYLSPILYPISILNGKILDFVMMNPITSWILIFREILFGKQPHVLLASAYISLQAIVFWIFGVLWIRRRWNDYIMLV